MPSHRTLRLHQLRPAPPERGRLIERLRSRAGAVAEAGARYWAFEEIDGGVVVEFIEGADYPSLEMAIAAADRAGALTGGAAGLTLKSLEL